MLDLRGLNKTPKKECHADVLTSQQAWVSSVHGNLCTGAGTFISRKAELHWKWFCCRVRALALHEQCAHLNYMFAPETFPKREQSLAEHPVPRDRAAHSDTTRAKQPTSPQLHMEERPSLNTHPAGLLLLQ